MPKLAANLSWIYQEVPFLQRFGAAAAHGFKAVEILFPYEAPAADIAAEDPHALAKVVRDTPEIWREVDQMILYPSFVHISHRKGGPQRGQLLYNRRYKGERF